MQRTRHSPPRWLPLALGALLGSLLLLTSALGLPAPLRITAEVLGRQTSALPSMGCAPGQCVNISFQFTGRATLNPAELRILFVPLNATVVVNYTPGAPVNLTYMANSGAWYSVREPGYLSWPIGGAIFDPDGNLRVGSLGGPTSIASGATFCLLGPPERNATPLEQFWLTFEYGSVDTTVLVAVQ